MIRRRCTGELRSYPLDLPSNKAADRLVRQLSPAIRGNGRSGAATGYCNLVWLFLRLGVVVLSSVRCKVMNEVAGLSERRSVSRYLHTYGIVHAYIPLRIDTLATTPEVLHTYVTTHRKK